MRWPRHLHLAHEASAEETRSNCRGLGQALGAPQRAGRSRLPRAVHTHQQEPGGVRPVCASVVLKAYKAKYRKLPTLGDDMTDEGEEGEDVDEGNGDSDS